MDWPPDMRFWLMRFIFYHFWPRAFPKYIKIYQDYPNMLSTYIFFWYMLTCFGDALGKNKNSNLINHILLDITFLCEKTPLGGNIAKSSCARSRHTGCHEEISSEGASDEVTHWVWHTYAWHRLCLSQCIYIYTRVYLCIDMPSNRTMYICLSLSIPLSIFPWIYVYIYVYIQWYT